MRYWTRRAALALSCSALTLGACGDAAKDTTDTTTPPEDTSVTTDTTTPPEDTSVTTDTTTPPEATSATDTTVADTTATADTTLPHDCDPDATPFGGTVVVPQLGTAHMLCSATHFDNIRTQPTANFAQVVDVDLSELGTWNPIPEFQGVIGADVGTKITGLKLDGTTEPNVAFIQYHTNGGRLQGLRFEDATFEGHSSGIVASFVRSVRFADLGKGQVAGAHIVDVHVSGTMKLTNGYAGGLARIIDSGGVIEGCTFTGTISAGTGLAAGDVYVGGLAYRVLGFGDLRESSFHGTIALPQQNKVGGLVAELVGEGIVTGCFVDAQIMGDTHLGGLVGRIGQDGWLSDSYFVGRLVASDETSGAIASAVFANDGSPRVERVYIAATVTGTTMAGPSAPQYSDIVYDSSLATLDAPDSASPTGLETSEMTNPDNAAWANFLTPPWVFTAGQLPTLDFTEE